MNIGTLCRWERFKQNINEVMSELGRYQEMKNGTRLKSYTVRWITPVGIMASASRHPNLAELIDFTKRAVTEKIGVGSVSSHFQIIDLSTGLVVYDSKLPSSQDSNQDTDPS